MEVLHLDLPLYRCQWAQWRLLHIPVPCPWSSSGEPGSLQASAPCQPPRGTSAAQTNAPLSWLSPDPPHLAQKGALLPDLVWGGGVNQPIQSSKGFRKGKSIVYIYLSLLPPVWHIWRVVFGQSHFQLSGADVDPNNLGEVRRQEYRTLAWTAAHIHCKLELSCGL